MALGAELTYDREADRWTGPAELRFAQLTLLREQPVQWGIGFRYYPFHKSGEPDWGGFFQVSVTLKLSD